MATQLSVQLTEGFRRYPIDDHGKLRFQYANVPALAVAYAANDQIELFKLPPGRVRILPHLSRISTSAWGASRTIDIGHRAYSKNPPDADLEAEDGDAFIDGMDVSAAVNAAVWSTALKFDMYSRTETVVFATILGGTMPVAGTLAVLCAYLYE
jgi:hypothetical protein